MIPQSTSTQPIRSSATHHTLLDVHALRRHILAELGLGLWAGRAEPTQTLTRWGSRLGQSAIACAAVDGSAASFGQLPVDSGAESGAGLVDAATLANQDGTEQAHNGQDYKTQAHIFAPTHSRASLSSNHTNAQPIANDATGLSVVIKDDYIAILHKLSFHLRAFVLADWLFLWDMDAVNADGDDGALLVNMEDMLTNKGVVVQNKQYGEQQCSLECAAHGALFGVLGIWLKDAKHIAHLTPFTGNIELPPPTDAVPTLAEMAQDVHKKAAFKQEILRPLLDLRTFA